VLPMTDQAVLVSKPVPRPTPDSLPYWEAAKRNILRLPRCEDCAKPFFYPRSACPTCGGTNISWIDCSGRATLHTYIISHRPAPGFQADAPYAVAVVELEEGPRLMTNIVGIPNTPEMLQLDMVLEVDFELRGEYSVPVFRPAGEVK
jgi:uncharacterized protein